MATSVTVACLAMLISSIELLMETLEKNSMSSLPERIVEEKSRYLMKYASMYFVNITESIISPWKRLTFGRKENKLEAALVGATHTTLGGLVSYLITIAEMLGKSSLWAEVGRNVAATRSKDEELC